VTGPATRHRTADGDDRPPLHLRRPFLAGLLRQLPLVVVLALVGAGLLVLTLGLWRVGLVAEGVALLAAAVLRLTLPVRRAGFLAVRSRPVDVLLLAGTGLVLTAIALAIPA
jgi:hypothetical protein